MKVLLGKTVLALTGWKLEGEIPKASRLVLIAAPHTSNWDLVHLLALAWAHGFPVSWMGKHSLFGPPFGGFMRWLGGVPVRRDRKNDLVSQMVRLFGESEELVLTIPPEGTRTATEFWKSGFYRIAVGARVPIHLGYLHYPTKRGSFGPPLHPTGDPRADMDVIRAHYTDKIGCYPERFLTPRLRDEEEASASPNDPGSSVPG